MRTILSLSIASALLLAMAGCGEDSGSTSDIAVIASTPQVADFTREVAGGRAEVTQLLPAEADPHDYEPQPSDAESLIDSDLIVASGGDIDPWLDQIVAGSGSEAPVLTLIDLVETLDDEDGGDDPHWWQDPRNAVGAVAQIRDALASVDPEGAASYDANAAAYIAELQRLDARIAACIERVPADDRKLVTSHDALNPYAARYGIEVIGAAIPALTTQAQASVGETAELVELIEASGVSTIFPEAGVSQDLEEAIAAEAGATLGGELWADTLGPEGSDGETYIEAQASNTEKLVAGFSGGEQRCEIG